MSTYQLRFHWDPLTLCRRLWWQLPSPIVAYLLHVANSNPPFNRTEFYGLKKRLLERFGLLESVEDIQHIVDDCWGVYDGYRCVQYPCGPNCGKCGGTGIFRERWFALRRYVWRGYNFHVPSHQIYAKPELPVTITGRIEHRGYEYRFTQECCLWLYLLCGEWAFLWKSLRSSCAGDWTWYPLLNLQKAVMKTAMRLDRHRWLCCFCGKWTWAWGSGWPTCRSCRRQPVVSDDVPF